MDLGTGISNAVIPFANSAILSGSVVSKFSAFISSSWNAGTWSPLLVAVVVMARLALLLFVCKGASWE